MTIAARRASAAAVAPFGSIVPAPSATPTSSGPGYVFWSDLAHYNILGETEIGICTVMALPSAPVDSMERHNRSPEILIPIDRPFVVPLMLEDPSSVPAAFRVDPGEAIIINRGVWHGACLPVGAKKSSYFVIFRRGTPSEDVDKKTVAPFKIRVR